MSSPENENVTEYALSSSSSSSIESSNLQQSQQSIKQFSVFKKLPSELTIEILSYVDIVSLFRFLDTCRYHRYLLLNLPEVWRRIRFLPLPEYTSLAAQATIPTTLAVTHTPSTSILAATSSSSLSSISTPISTSTSTSTFTSTLTSTSISTTLSEKSPASSAAPSSSPASTNLGEPSSPSKTKPKPMHASRRLKHAENERDRERGGSESLTSEIYAVLRRFRKSNGLVDYVREVYMDGTDTVYFPSPLVMMIKFPHLRVLSSRYRRNETSLVRETNLLKGMLKNGTFTPHGLQLRQWDIFHPYMTKEEGITTLKHILDEITLVGQPVPGEKAPVGVILDIKRCPGVEKSSSNMIHGGGIHWAPNTAPSQPQAATTPLIESIGDMNNTAGTVTSTTQPSSVPPVCPNIVWTLEKCRVCDAPQDRCWQCVAICNQCNAIRAPPHINHQTLLERERQRTTKSLTDRAMAENINGSQSLQLQSQPHRFVARPVTPPGSISLSRMANPTLPLPSAYAHLPPTPDPLLARPSQPIALALPPEFSFFD
ncbi:hypothetical protein BGZ94_004102 [Podila epigama]|nr:hypothetical protein BGZ94_004102 [Podila epigama]